MPPNQFYIQPANFDTRPVLQGIGALASGAREAGVKQQKQNQLADVMATDDPAQIADFMIKNPELQAQIKGGVQFKNEATEKNYSNFLTGFLANPTRDNFAEMAEARSKFVRGQGGDSSGIDNAIALYDEDPEAAIKKAETALSMFDPKKFKSFRSSKTGGDGKEAIEIRKETRGGIRKQLGAISKEANVIRSNYKKLENLAGEIRKGNRQAVPQALVAIVKLGDPGSIVSTNEMKGALNSEDPIAAVFNLLTGKGVNTDLAQSIAGKIDPLNPENINVDDLLATGRATVSAFVPTLQDRFASENEIAEENLTPAGKKSLFSQGLRNNINSLSDLIPAKPAPVQDLSSMSLEELQALKAQATK